MKKSIVVAILFQCALSLTATVHGQGLHIGIKGGANMGKIDGMTFRDSYKLGYHLGGFIEIPLGNPFSIQPEVLFSQTNTRIESGLGNIFSPGSNIQLRYLSIPILLKVNLADAFALMAGPQYSILLNNEKSIFANAQKAFSSGDFSLAMGVQFQLSVVRLYGRYNIGLSNVSDITSSDKWKSQQLQFGLGLPL